MKALSSLALISLTLSPALFVQAVPTPRSSGSSSISSTAGHIYGKRAYDSDILAFKFADVLEQLEASFYTQALAKFTASDIQAAGFTSGNVPFEQLKIIQEDEITHSSTLESALKSAGATPVTCNFNFDDELETVGTMLATARIAENVGTSAYSGATTLIKDTSLLATAATILAVEGRHSTVLNILSGSGTAVPSSFDIALNASEVLAIVAPFIVGPCNTSITANPTLTITTRGDIETNSLVTFNSTAFDSSSEGDLFCQLLTGNLTAAIALPLKECVIPPGISGPTYIWITHSSDPLPNDVVARSTSQAVAAGPALTFIDLGPQTLGLAAVEGPPTTTTSSSTAQVSPSSLVEAYNCWFHGQHCRGSSV